MYELTIETGFSSSHNIRGYDGACERLHGHNWDVEVTVEAAGLDAMEIAVDFRVLKEKTNKVVDGLDHRYLNETPPFDKLNPTAENIARYIYKGVAGLVNDGNVRVSRVKVWETRTSSAAYYE